ncbi:zinc finger, CCHC-type containing protein [Tanacetum coccineum]
MGRSYYPIPCSILSTGKERKTPQRYRDVPTTSWRISIRINELTQPLSMPSILIEGLVDNRRFNDSLSGVRVGQMKGKTYNLSPRGPIYEAILKKKITRKEDIGGNFEIPCNIGGLRHINALVDQGSDVNVMPLSTYMKLTDERLAETNIRLSLASHLYIYPLGIAEDILVNVAGYVYPVDFVILDIKEDKRGCWAPLADEELEVLEPSDIRITLLHTSASSDSTSPLSPDHPLTEASPT